MSVYSNSDSANIALIVVHSVLTIVNIAGNFLVCIIIIKNRDMRNLLDYLLLNLAIADSSTVIFLSPKYIFSHAFSHPDGSLGNALCIAVTGGNIGWVGAVTSVFCLVAIAAERYYAVVYPIKYVARPLRKRNLKVIITCTWILGVIFNIPSFIYRRYNEKQKYCINTWPSVWVGKAYSLSWLLLAVLSTSLMAVLYFRVAYTMWFKKEEHRRESNLRQRAVPRMRKRATLMVMLVSLVFGMCWVTDRTNYVIVHFYSPSDAFFSLAASNTLVLINSTINPIVYALVNHRFREKAKIMLRRVCCRISDISLPGAGGPQEMALQRRGTRGISQAEPQSRPPSITLL